MQTVGLHSSQSNTALYPKQVHPKYCRARERSLQVSKRDFRDGRYCDSTHKTILAFGISRLFSIQDQSNVHLVEDRAIKAARLMSSDRPREKIKNIDSVNI